MPPKKGEKIKKGKPRGCAKETGRKKPEKRESVQPNNLVTSLFKSPNLSGTQEVFNEGIPAKRRLFKKRDPIRGANQRQAFKP